MTRGPAKGGTVGTRGRVALACAGAATMLAGCGGGGPGNATIFVEPEETITDGLSPGDGLEDVQDGWTVAYTKFVMVLGNVRAGKSNDAGAQIADASLQVVDLQNLPTVGLVLASWVGIAEGRWDRLGYDQGYAGPDAVRAPGTSASDHAAMVAAGTSLWIAGTVTKDARTVAFDWPLRSGVSWSDCGPPSGDKGFAVPSGGTAQIGATIHGDHWFFNSFPQGDETTTRLAGWVAAVDAMTGGDGLVSAADLQAVAAAAVFSASAGYRLSNPFGDAIDTVYDYVVTQARTIGHVQGEGECATLTRL